MLYEYIGIWMILCECVFYKGFPEKNSYVVHDYKEKDLCVCVYV